MRAARAWIIVFIALWAGCSKCPDGDTAGTSAGCGNPIKTAELVPIAQNSCAAADGMCGATWPPTPYRVSFGDSLSIRLTFLNVVVPDSVAGSLYLFEAGQVPVFDPLPLDSLSLRDSVFVITPKDLEHIRRKSSGDSSYSAFSAFVRLSYYFHGTIYSQGGLLAGLVYDWNFGSFSYSNHNPLAVPGSSRSFRSAIGGRYEGILSIPDSLVTGAGSMYVYVSGSPFFTTVNIDDRKFSLDSLPLGESYELRFFAMPITNKRGGTAPVFRLESGPASDSNRVFGLRDLKETIALP